MPRTRRVGRPKNPLSKTCLILIRVTPRVRRKICRAAKADHRRDSEWCRVKLEEALAL